MKTKFIFPEKIKQFAKKERINIKEIKEIILTNLDEDIMNKEYNVIKPKKIKIIVNGIHKINGNKIFISPKKFLMFI